jgi:hypothetical protein
MANNVNIFDKYGIKEVANVYFEALDDDLKTGVYKGDIVLFLDTLKVSTIETTAENVAAQGGWGNPKLVQWDYGKEINITLEDALMSLESLRFMMGGSIKRPDSAKHNTVIVRHTEEVTVKADGSFDAPVDHITGIPFDGVTPTSSDTSKHGPAIVASTAHPVKLINLGGGLYTTTTNGGSENNVGKPSLAAGTRTQLTSGTIAATGNKVKFTNPEAGVSQVDPAPGDKIRIFWETELAGASSEKEDAVEVTISPDTFPGTYKVIGDTLIRSEKTGRDEPFQFIINKAKVQSNVTLTLQAEGDPSTFEMTLNVLRDGDEMMKLVRYNVTSGTDQSVGNDVGSLAVSNSDNP